MEAMELTKTGQFIRTMGADLNQGQRKVNMFPSGTRSVLMFTCQTQPNTGVYTQPQHRQTLAGN
mgnify:CR=1 FL=1